MGESVAGSANYSQLVAKAEKAVEAVKNPSLKRLAFQKVLDDMLASGSDRGKRKTGSSSAAKSKKGAAGKKDKKGGPMFYVEELEGEGFFKKQKTIAQVRTALVNRGHHLPVTSLSGPLQKLCQRKVLRRERIADEKKKKGFAYSEW
jgi:hypothetical protein